MNQFTNYRPFPDSSRPAFRGMPNGKPAVIESVEFVFQLRKPAPINLKPGIFAGRNRSRSQIKLEMSANLRDIALVVDFAKQNDLWIDKIDRAKRLVYAHGSARAIEAAFKIQLTLSMTASGDTYRIRQGVISLPDALHEVVTGVFGIDERPQARPHIERCRSHQRSLRKPRGFDGKILSEIYSFPRSNGAGQTIAIIELGGGFWPPDLAAFFKTIGLDVPEIEIVSIDGARNHPYIDDGADGEVALDIQVCGAVAPKAKLVVYFAPNTDSGFLQAILTAIHDDKNKPSIITISWGMAESGWTKQSIKAMNDAFETAAALGITVFAAAGDDGVNDDQDDGMPHVDFPASSPFVTACGGTSLFVAEGIRREKVWNAGSNSATGGGISAYFDKPPYQLYLDMPVSLSSNKPGRGVPDMSAVADPNTLYTVFVNGAWDLFGGTSAVAPLFAGMIARFNQHLSKPVGFLNRYIYRADAGDCFTDIVDGDNSSGDIKGYFATKGWDAASGFGVPIGTALLRFIVNQISQEQALMPGALDVQNSSH